MIFLRVLSKKFSLAALLGGPRSSGPGSLNRLNPPVPTPLSIGQCFHRLLEGWVRITTHSTFHSSVGRWRHKIRKFAAESFKNAKKIGSRVVPYTSNSFTIYIAINSTRVYQHMRVTISCRYCIAIEVMLLFLVASKFHHIAKV